MFKLIISKTFLFENQFFFFLCIRIFRTYNNIYNHYVLATVYTLVPIDRDEQKKKKKKRTHLADNIRASRSLGFEWWRYFKFLKVSSIYEKFENFWNCEESLQRDGNASGTLRIQCLVRNTQ